MPKKTIQKSIITRLTMNQEFKYAGYDTETVEITFTNTFNTAYYNNHTFKKIKGGGKYGGNYICVEQEDEYRISKY